MRKKPVKMSISIALKSIEQAAAVLMAISRAADGMDPSDISDAIDACSGLVNEARCELAILEGEL